jgi:hypothetical protein
LATSPLESSFVFLAIVLDTVTTILFQVANTLALRVQHVGPELLQERLKQMPDGEQQQFASEEWSAGR